VGEGLLAGPAALLGGLRPGPGDLLGDQGAQARGTGLGLGTSSLEAFDGALGLVGGLGDDAHRLGLRLLAGRPGLALHLAGCERGDLGDVLGALAGVGDLGGHPLGDPGDDVLEASAYVTDVGRRLRVRGPADRVGLGLGTGQHRGDGLRRPLGLLGGLPQLLLALGAGGGERVGRGLADPLGLGSGRVPQLLRLRTGLVAHPGGLRGGALAQRLGLGGGRVEVALARGAGLLDDAGGALLGGRHGGLRLGARGSHQGRRFRGCRVAQLLGLGAQGGGRLGGTGAELVALTPGGRDLLVARTLCGAHQQPGLLVGVEDDRRGLLGRTGEHLLGLVAGPAGLGAVALGLGLELAGLLAQHGQVGGESLRLRPRLLLELVGDLLGPGEQGGGRGVPGRGGRGFDVHCHLLPPAESEVPILSGHP